MKLQKPEYLPGDKLADGTLYVGIISDGKKAYHISIEPQNEPNEMTWYEAVKLEGGPTLRELKLISANAKILGLGDDNKWYWSSTEYTNNNAYCERFSDGYQGNGNKNLGALMRCVRRYSIIPSFDHLLPELAELKNRIAAIEEKMK